ncbi:hypothetical protein GFY24_34155 [Nocardia sp. SYP-A9097]|uniref:hypothetical protein n=1 Tax=Nocardia sp. SYP-A9097 TaxID=2663237 RepID=UPI00129BD327|nr:hypothetical protein [Nocardia sp. SYP-A9097]MRH92411.1 hypothetical protein [Nocardia sp. SYP-A9097]
MSNPDLMTTQYIPVGCTQSRHNFAKQVAAALAVTTFFDASCGGAVTADMTHPQEGPQSLAGAIPAQFDHLTP